MILELISGVSSGTISVVWFVLGIWGSIVLTLSAASIVLAMVRQKLGLRHYYIRLLLIFFDWARRRYNPVISKGDESDSESDNYEKNDTEPQLKNGTETLARKQAPSNGSDIIEAEGYRDFAERVASKEKPAEVVFTDIVYDTVDMAKWGIEVIITDEVTSCFTVKDLEAWNLLTRTDTRGYTFMSWRLSLLVMIGKIFRYGFMLPSRILIFIFGVNYFIATSLLLYPVPESPCRRRLAKYFFTSTIRMTSRMVSLMVTYHGRKNQAKPGTICVANHTSFLDMGVLGQDNYFAVIGQRWAGFQGFLQKMASSLIVCKWFERGETKERSSTLDAMRDHLATNGPPILLFPEGTCASAGTLMQFRKGSFELGVTIHPVVIKYDRTFGEPFYYQDTWYQHLASLMSSWAIKADVYYLPPMRQREGETGIEFSRRVKEAIALKGGFLPVEWDGFTEKSVIMPVDWDQYVKVVRVREEKVQKMRAFYSSRLERIRQEMLSVSQDEPFYDALDEIDD